jgi:predicted RNase H-like HicB family nuclease
LLKSRRGGNVSSNLLPGGRQVYGVQKVIFYSRFYCYITLTEKSNMEKIINLHIEKLPEGYYLATSDSIQGLVAQGRTVIETLEIARDVAIKLIESREEIQ